MLNKGESLVTAFATYENGPGWSNSPIWVIVCDRDEKLRMECIQPEDQTAEMRILFRVSSAAHTTMTNAVESCFAKKWKVCLNLR